MSKRLRIVVLVDPEAVEGEDPAFFGFKELADLEQSICDGLQNLGHDLTVLPFRPETKQLGGIITRILTARPDIVFNLVEHMYGDRRKASAVPALLEVLGIPYTGCPQAGMCLALDKAASKYLANVAGFAIPSFVVVSPYHIPVKTRFKSYPAIVKPQFGGASEGIEESSIVNCHLDMIKQARIIHHRFRQPAICEEYIQGRELSVGLIGDHIDITALPIRETVFGEVLAGAPGFCTEAAKANAALRLRWGITYSQASLPGALSERIAGLCKDVFRSLDLSGYARMDLRLTSEDEPVFLEANANPDLTPAFFGAMASWAGIGYESVLSSVVKFGLRRGGTE